MKIRTISAATCAALAFSMAGPIYAYDSEAETVRILNPEYAIHTFDPDGELVAMSRTRLSYVDTSEWLAFVAR